MVENTAPAVDTSAPAATPAPQGPDFGRPLPNMPDVSNLTDSQRASLAQTFQKFGYSQQAIARAFARPDPNAPAPAKPAPLRDDLKAGAGTVLPDHVLRS